MKTISAFFVFILFSYGLHAQIGVGTTSPNSTLDVRGSLAGAVTTFTSATTAGISDNFLVFTGSSGTTLTLPTAVGITGRIYWIKNAGTATLTIDPNGAETIDGLTTWPLAQSNKALRIVSNGTKWYILSESVPGSGSGASWILGGNNVPSAQNLGTISNFDLPFITNNTEKMRLSSTGNLAIGTSTFNGTYPEKLLVDGGTTTSVNAIVGKGSINNYLQLNIQNLSTGTNASSDVVATASNGSETTNYVDLGINGGGNTSGVLGTADDAYLYNIGQNFFIGTGTASKSLIFLTGGTDSATNERMRIDPNGNVGIGTASPAAALHVVKSNSGGNVLTLQNTNAAGFSSADFYSNTNVLSGTFGYGNSGTGAPFTGRSYFNMYGNDFVFGNGSSTPLFIEASTNTVGINNTSPSEKLDVTGNIKFSGALMPGGSAGTVGRFLVSTGPGTAPTWFDASGYAWLIGGNTVGAEQELGPTDNFALPFITNGTERMRISNTGNVAIGTSTFNGTYPEKLVVDAGTTASVNAIVGKGSINNYLQLNIQNLSTGTNASSDVVATASNGTELTNFIDMGINGGGNTSGILGTADDAYLYNMGQNLFIGTGTASKSLIFLTGGTDSATNERMVITGAGNVGVGSNTPTSTLQGGGSFALPLVTKTVTYAATANDYTILCNTTSGIVTINLPTAVGIAGRIYVIKRITATSNNAVIDGSGTQTIDGALTQTLSTQYASYMIQSDGANWVILSKN